MSNISLIFLQIWRGSIFQLSSLFQLISHKSKNIFTGNWCLTIKKIKTYLQEIERAWAGNKPLNKCSKWWAWRYMYGQFLYFRETSDSSTGFHLFFLNLDHRNTKIFLQDYKIKYLIREEIANIKINTCASNSAILCKDACSMQERRLHSSSSIPVIWYLNSAISWARSSASSFAFNFSSLSSSYQPFSLCLSAIVYWHLQIEREVYNLGIDQGLRSRNKLTYVSFQHWLELFIYLLEFYEFSWNAVV